MKFNKESEFLENSYKKVVHKYTKDLKAINLENKLLIILDQILKGGEKIVTIKQKNKDASDNDKQLLLDQYLNMLTWHERCILLDPSNDEDKGVIEEIFVQSILYTPGFRKFAKNFRLVKNATEVLKTMLENTNEKFEFQKEIITQYIIENDLALKEDPVENLYLHVQTETGGGKGSPNYPDGEITNYYITKELFYKTKRDMEIEAFNEL